MKPAFYHDLSAVARRALACAALLAASTLSACSVSMPIAGFVDETPTPAIAAKGPDSPTSQTNSDPDAKDLTMIHLAAAQSNM